MELLLLIALLLMVGRLTDSVTMNNKFEDVMAKNYVHKHDAGIAEQTASEKCASISLPTSKHILYPPSNIDTHYKFLERSSKI